MAVMNFLNMCACVWLPLSAQLDSNKPVQEISERVGYLRQRVFLRVFKDLWRPGEVTAKGCHTLTGI